MCPSTLSDVLVVKLGGAMLTKRDRPRVADHGWVEWLPPLLGAYHGPLCLVHGLGSFGRAWMAEYGPDGTIRRDRSALARAIQSDLRRFHDDVLTSLEGTGRPVRSFEPESLFRVARGRICEGWAAPIAASMTSGEIPVLYGGTVLDAGGGFCILSSDDIVEFVARRLPAERVVWLSDVPGVYVDGPDGSRMLSPRLSPDDGHRLSVVGDDTADVTGGMRKKVDRALGLAGHGIPSRIVLGLDAGAVKAAVSNEGGGTLIQRHMEET
jgi:isopentenyl phosphate kinase